MNKPRTRDRILEKIKTEIDLVCFAISKGYEINRRKTSLGSACLERGKKDTIIVAKDTDGHFVYFNPRNHTDGGSILDFVMNKESKSLRQAKEDLQSLIGVALDSRRVAFVPKLAKSDKNTIEVMKLYSQLEDISENSKVHGYFRARCLEISDCINERFAGKIKTDSYNAAIFPHYNEKGIVGWEAKNWNFTGCPKGSDKGIWASNRKKTDTILVIAESGIDCLSYYALKNHQNSWFVSTGGGWSHTRR